LEERFSGLDIDKIDLVKRELIQLKSFKILHNANKKDISRFIRSVNGATPESLNDTFSMIARCIEAIRSLSEEIQAVKAEDAESPQIEQIQAKKDIFSQKLKEFESINDVIAIHDRLVPLLQALDVDNKESLSQERFKELQKSSKMVKTLGFRLYFPKSRGDLTALGNAHGWCVGSSQTYGDNVKNKRDVLVGICSKDAEPAIDAVLALAYFSRQGDDFQISELKWSMRVKGKKNVEAIDDFNHEVIRTLLVEHLKEYYGNMKE